MKLIIAWLVLFTTSIYTVTTQDALHADRIEGKEGDRMLVPLVDRNDWVNPETLAPMPQCVAQQDQAIWLNRMTQCVWRQCTRHFGVICSHHQWLIQLSCLHNEFTSDVVRVYLPYCSRSVLAKAQLAGWIYGITGRNWLVDVGDSNEIHSLSPASLAQGYVAIDVISKAPACLTESASSSSMELFQHIVASCGFAAHTEHTGNAARPWEYSEALRSMVALDSETVGYDLTHRSIASGEYFDKRCFCKLFRTDPRAEPCPGPGLASTRARLWIYATCGSDALSGDWKDGLQTTTFAYIPIEDWRWPDCVHDMPKKVLGLREQCTTDACGVDDTGYCNTRRAVERACFCRSVSYDSCKGSCHIFERRVDYVEWLHDLCGAVEGWHGLPKHWAQLAAPTRFDMIPWDWSIKASCDSNNSSIRHTGSSTSMQACASTDWKLACLVLINIATLLFRSYGPRRETGPRRHDLLWFLYPKSWLSRGLIIAALHVLANWANAYLVQTTPGYEETHVIRLMLLWCSMPRLTWLTVLLTGLQRFNSTSFAAVASCLLAETVLQVLSAIYLVVTVDYGREHGFYSNGMARIRISSSAQFMYAGALMWLAVAVVTLVLLLTSKPRAGRKEVVDPLNQQWTWLEDKMILYWIDKSWDLEEELLLRREEQAYTAYGTLAIKSTSDRSVIKRMVRVYLVAVIGMCLLWIAQWLFWGGFIGLSVEEYVHKRHLGFDFSLANGNEILSASTWLSYTCLGRNSGAVVALIGKFVGVGLGNGAVKREGEVLQESSALRVAFADTPMIGGRLHELWLGARDVAVSLPSAHQPQQ